MWSKLDDALLDHEKIFAAGDLIGRNGPVIAIGLYSMGLMWTNKHLTDGRIPIAVVRRWRHADDPIRAADALVHAGLWEKNGTGYIVHDFHDHNPTAESVKRKREEDRKRKAAKKE